jgi:hypothetical protein
MRARLRCLLKTGFRVVKGVALARVVVAAPAGAFDREQARKAMEETRAASLAKWRMTRIAAEVDFMDSGVSRA